MILDTATNKNPENVITSAVAEMIVVDKEGTYKRGPVKHASKQESEDLAGPYQKKHCKGNETCRVDKAKEMNKQVKKNSNTIKGIHEYLEIKRINQKYKKRCDTGPCHEYDLVTSFYHLVDHLAQQWIPGVKIVFRTFGKELPKVCSRLRERMRDRGWSAKGDFCPEASNELRSSNAFFDCRANRVEKSADDGHTVREELKKWLNDTTNGVTYRYGTTGYKINFRFVRDD